MNWDQVTGKLKQLEGEIRENWGRFVHDEDEERIGRLVLLDGMLQEQRGTMRAKVERKLETLQSAIGRR